MNTVHHIHFRNAGQMGFIDDDSIDLVVTSPPYPMIGMWDEIFSQADPEVAAALESGDGQSAYSKMHMVLEPVWDEVWRVVRPGGFICINIGDAVRTIGDHFGLYPNHVRIMEAMQQRGANPLPAILWRKQTNAPNKYMGSGMLPAGAYVTLEHEYILVFRKGSKRKFDSPVEKLKRRESAYFWEERNQWFSDIWLDLKGARQQLIEKQVRTRSGAFPFELPYRLIHMYSVKNDMVLDPFAGTGTTMFAAMAGKRNSIGFETDVNFAGIIEAKAMEMASFANGYIESRIQRHTDWAAERQASKGPLKYVNNTHGFPVMTRQEADMIIEPIESVRGAGEGVFEVEYGKPSKHARRTDSFVQESAPSGKKLRMKQTRLF